MCNIIKQADGSYASVGSIADKVVDDTEDFAVSTTAVPPEKECVDYYTESECTGAGCYWYNGACHSMPPGVTCSDYMTASTCTAAGCHWYEGRCHQIPQVPTEIPWALILGAIGGAAVLIGIVVAIKRG